MTCIVDNQKAKQDDLATTAVYVRNIGIQISYCKHHTEKEIVEAVERRLE